MDGLSSALISVRIGSIGCPTRWLALILALAVVIALALHHWLRNLVHRLLAGRYPSLLSIFTGCAE